MDTWRSRTPPRSPPRASSMPTASDRDDEGAPTGLVTRRGEPPAHPVAHGRTIRPSRRGAPARGGGGGGRGGDHVGPRDGDAGGGRAGTTWRCCCGIGRGSPWTWCPSWRRWTSRACSTWGSARSAATSPTDGSIGARTAALAAPYVDGGEGATAYADDVLAAFFHDGHDAGLQVGVHAIGDRAIEQVLGTWERVYGALDSRERRHFRARRHRIEHAEMASPTQVERAAVLGIAMSVQPAFDDRWGGRGASTSRPSVPIVPPR